MVQLSIKIILAAVLGVLLSPAISHAASTQQYGNIKVSVQPSLPGESSHGYIERGFIIENHSPSQKHKVTISLPKSSRNSYQSYIKRLSRTITLAPMSSADVKLYQPYLSLRDNYAAVSIDAIPQEKQLVIKRFDYSPYNNSISILHTKNIESDLINKLETDLKGLKHRRAREVKFGRLEQSIEQLPSNPLAYSRYDGIILTTDDYNKLGQKAKDAITTYTEQGGNLLITGTATVPKPWNKYRQIKGQQYSTVGFGRLFPKTKPGGGWTKANFSTLAQSIVDLRDNLSSNNDYNQYGHGSAKYNKAFPVIDGLGIPIRTLFFVMLIFSIIIGPVNIIYLIKKKKRILLLVTTPVISLIFTVVLSACAMISEGVQGTSRTSTFTILDQTSKKATTIGATAYYSPVTPWGGLKFESNTELNLCADNQRNRKGYVIDQSAGQHLGDGWINARVPVHFKIRKSETRRERVNFTMSGSSITALNGFPADIATLYFANGKGELYTATNIPAGQKATLERKDNQHVFNQGKGKVSYLNTIYKNGLLKEVKITAKTAQHLVPNSYLAIMDSSPFVEKALEDCKEEQHRSIVFGLIGEAK